MLELNGKYSSAIVYNDEVEQTAISQIINLLNHPVAENAHIRIMPDVHTGAGCVIGYTAKLVDKIVPNLIGVDINCRLLGYNLGHKKDLKLKFDKLDNFIRLNIPSGHEINNEFDEDEIMKVWKLLSYKDFIHWIDYKSELEMICKKHIKI